MKNKVKLLLADSSTELMSRISVFFEGKGDVEVVGKAADGIEATEMLRELTPDVVLMEIVLPKKDGIAVLKDINAIPASRRPIVIVMTGAKKESVTNLCMELGADYFMIKPCEPETIYERIKLLSTSLAAKQHGGRIAMRRISTPATDRATAQLKFPLQTRFIRWACLQILRATSICATLL